MDMLQERSFKVDRVHAEREARVVSQVRLFFREALDVRTFSAEPREEFLQETINKFRDFLADEQEGDEVYVAKALRDALRNVANSYPFESAREFVFRLCGEAALAMSAEERDALKRSVENFYFADEEDENVFVAKSERVRLTRNLCDALLAVDEIQGDLPPEDPERRDSFSLLVDELEFDEGVEEIKGILLLGLGKVSERDHLRIKKILEREKHEASRGVMLARALELYRGYWVRGQELQRLVKEGVSFSKNDFLDANILSAVDAVFARRIATPGVSFSFEHFFPGETAVSQETTFVLFTHAAQKIAYDLPRVLKSFAKEYEKFPRQYAFVVNDVFDRIDCFMQSFLRQVPVKEEKEMRALFLQSLEQGGGELYLQWREQKASQRREYVAQVAAEIRERYPVPLHDVPQKLSSSVESLPPVVNVSNEKEPDKKEPEAPLVVSPSKEVRNVSKPERRGTPEISKESVLGRLEAGGLVHLAEDMHKRPEAFAALLRDGDVQVAAWRALERMMRLGFFGVVERTAPVFLGDDWRTEGVSLRTLAREYILQILVAEYRGDAGSRLPVAVLQKKAAAFGFDWQALEQEARGKVSVKAVKKGKIKK